MADKQLRYILTGVDQSASKTMLGAATAGEVVDERFVVVGPGTTDEDGTMRPPAPPPSPSKQ
jgi:hypothetical protein